MPRPCQELELNSLRIQTGTRWCLDWELQLLGSSRSRFIKCPRDLRIALGDSLVISLPPEALGISCKIYTGDGGAVSKPSLEQVQVQKGKRGKKARGALHSTSDFASLCCEVQMCPAPIV